MRRKDKETAGIDEKLEIIKLRINDEPSKVMDKKFYFCNDFKRISCVSVLSPNDYFGIVFN
ncbi:MAG: hypothetical protein FWF73_05560 [Spirochaetes bacterium]|nr:hypothetical protein [Spirochaetota bacterium]